MSSVIFDAPGPRGRARNMVVGTITIAALVAFLIFVIYKLSATGQFDSQKWQLFTYPLVIERLIGGLFNTLLGFGLGVIFAFLLGVTLAVGRLSSKVWISYPISFINDILRATPVLLFMVLIYYGFPTLGVKTSPLFAVVCALALYNGAVIAEILRSGIDSVPRGQSEAAFALGLRKGHTYRLILFPQAIKNMMPALVAQMVVVLKDTALGFIVTYHELLYLANFYGSQARYGIPIIPATIIIGTVYVTLCLLLAGTAKLVEIKLASKKI